LTQVTAKEDQAEQLAALSIHVEYYGVVDPSQDVLAKLPNHCTPRLLAGLKDDEEDDPARPNMVSAEKLSLIGRLLKRRNAIGHFSKKQACFAL